MKQQKIGEVIKGHPLLQYANVIAIIGIAVTLTIYFLQDKKKEITFSIEGQIALVDFQSIKSDSITIKYGDIDVKNLFKIELKIENTGNTAILKSDLIDSLQIKLGKSSKLIDFTINSIPKKMVVYSKKEINSLIIQPDLINPNDNLKINLYYTSNDQKPSLPKFEPRIVDGYYKYIDKVDSEKTKNRFYVKLPFVFEILLLILASLFCLTIAGIFAYLVFIDKDKKGWQEKLFYTTFVVCGLITLSYILLNEFL